VKRKKGLMRAGKRGGEKGGVPKIRFTKVCSAHVLVTGRGGEGRGAALVSKNIGTVAD